jgi:glutamate 5-kinase
MSTRDKLGQSRRWVIKIGSALLTNDGRGLDFTAIAAWVEQMVGLKQAGRELVLVSSGAVAEGMCRLGWTKRPHALHELQAAAAVGQMGLVQAYESRFLQHSMHAAQVLLTHEDLADRRRYLNARSTLRTLLKLNVIPVVNENDTVATEEIKFGDNDTLAALVANLVEADLLVILTDQKGVYDCDPRQNPAANLLHEVAADDPELERVAGGGGALGRGGMITKVRAARRAARSGASTIIVSGREPDILRRVSQGERVGTLLTPHEGPIAARKQWLASHMTARGGLRLDAGAVSVLRQAGRSLLPVGVTGVEGEFNRGELVICKAPDGTEIARGLVNYSAEEAARIIGYPSDRIESILGYVDEPELIHRDNLVVV